MTRLSSFRRRIQKTYNTIGLDSAEVLSLTAGASSMTYLSTKDSLPYDNLSAGDKAFVESDQMYYISNGSGWYRVSAVNLSPSFDSDLNSTFTIVDSATPLIITNPATDPDDPATGIAYTGTASDSAQYLVNITIDSSQWTFTPLSKDSVFDNVTAGNLTDSDGGDFTYTFKASDGFSFAQKLVTINYTGLTAVPAGIISAASGTYREQSVTLNRSGLTGTTTIYESGLSAGAPIRTNSATSFILNTNPGGVFYVAMVGGGGAAPYNSGNRQQGSDGVGGFSIMKVVVPPGATQLQFIAGGAGQHTRNGNSTGAGGQAGGARGGQGGSNYNASSGGGGWTGVFTSTSSYSSITQSDVVCMVGGGGGAGSQADTGGYGGAAGNDGGNSLTATQRTGAGGSTTAGGAGATQSPGHQRHNAPAAGTAMNGGIGAGSLYDAGGGGGGGYFGGGGGRTGGGYNGGAGGGGSGYYDASYCEFPTALTGQPESTFRIDGRSYGGTGGGYTVYTTILNYWSSHYTLDVGLYGHGLSGGTGSYAPEAGYTGFIAAWNA